MIARILRMLMVPPLVVVVFTILIWCITTTWLGAVTVIRGVRYLWRLRMAASSTLSCPRKHASSVLGVWQCAGCHGVWEGWVYRPCKVCGAGADWTPCAICGLSIPNPVRW
jgi:hypothetical protein